MKIENQVPAIELAQEYARLMKEKGKVLPESYFYYVKDSNNFDGIFRIDDVMYEWREDDEYSEKIPLLTDIINNPEWSDWKNDEDIMIIPALTVAELGELLPDDLNTYYTAKGMGDWRAYKRDSEDDLEPMFFDINEPTEADARQKMLNYLLANDLT